MGWDVQSYSAAHTLEIVFTRVLVADKLFYLAFVYWDLPFSEQNENILDTWQTFLLEMQIE